MAVARKLSTDANSSMVVPYQGKAIPTLTFKVIFPLKIAMPST